MLRPELEHRLPTSWCPASLCSVHCHAQCPLEPAHSHQSGLPGPPLRTAGLGSICCSLRPLPLPGDSAAPTAWPQGPPGLTSRHPPCSPSSQAQGCWEGPPCRLWPRSPTARAPAVLPPRALALWPRHCSCSEHPFPHRYTGNEVTGVLLARAHSGPGPSHALSHLALGWRGTEK